MVFNTGAALLDAIVLAVVSKEPEGTYGYKITQEVRQVIELSESTLYPVLRRLQKDDCLAVYDMECAGRRASRRSAGRRARSAGGRPSSGRRSAAGCGWAPSAGVRASMRSTAPVAARASVPLETHRRDEPPTRTRCCRGGCC